jgi:hypothetical protein
LLRDSPAYRRVVVRDLDVDETERVREGVQS